MRSPVVVVACVSLVTLAGCSKKIAQNFEGSIGMRTTIAGKPPQDMSLDIKAGKMRFDTKSDTGEPMHGVYDPAKNVVQMFLDTQKTYLTLDFAKASAPQPNTTGEASTAEKAGTKDTVAGISCENWIAKEPSGKRSEVCVVDGVNFFDLARLRSGGKTGAASMQDKKMFPLRSVEYDEKGAELSRMEVTSVEKHAVDDARFAAPAGYTETKLPAP